MISKYVTLDEDDSKYPSQFKLQGSKAPLYNKGDYISNALDADDEADEEYESLNEDDQIGDNLNFTRTGEVTLETPLCSQNQTLAKFHSYFANQ